MKNTTTKSVKKSKTGRYEAYNGEMIYFQSNAKADRYLQLVKFLENKSITDLEIKPSYDAVVQNKKMCTFTPDFRYMTLEPNDHRGYQVIEDVVGVTTDVYKLKVSLIEATNFIKVHSIPAKEIDTWAEIIPLNQ